jgi:flagellar basal-body rod modification protein FlgD
MFLNLLTTQLQNQDPTNPMDAGQFTQQLVEYSQVEQQISTNATLSTISNSLSVSNATSMLSYVGQTVTADGSQTTLQNGNAQWSFSLDRAATATVNVLDSSGNVVYSQTSPYASGANTFTWNGQGTGGSTEPAGTYTISVTGQDSSGNAATVTTAVTGTVTGVDFSSGQPYLNINGSKVSVWSVSTVGS